MGNEFSKVIFSPKDRESYLFLFLFFYFAFQPSQEIEKINSIENPDIAGTKFNHGGTTSTSSRKQVSIVKSDYRMDFYFYFFMGHWR